VCAWLCAALQTELTALQQRLQQVIDRIKAPSTGSAPSLVFVKTSSRSPKDASILSAKLESCFKAKWSARTAAAAQATAKSAATASASTTAVAPASAPVSVEQKADDNQKLICLLEGS
jgi:hypothetical protein